MEHLATFVQISDLHHGPEVAISEQFPWVRFRGHSPQALENVAMFLERLGSETGVPPGLILTGDLTSFGEKCQFAQVTDFLGQPPSRSGEPSLNRPNWKQYTIPGNHDHWPGKPRFTGQTTSAFYSTFDPMPDASTVCPLENGLLVRFLRIDTDANVAPKSLDRWLAIGRFKEHLAQFSNALGGKPTNEIWVLMLHHSAMYEQRLVRLDLGNYIHKDSRQELNRFIKKHDIALLLCGHTHEAGLEMYDADGTEVLEARCGTTAQSSVKEDLDRTNDAGSAGDQPVDDASVWRRSLLVHRLTSVGQAVFWEAQIYLENRNEALRFEPAANRGPLVKMIQVWRRP